MNIYLPVVIAIVGLIIFLVGLIVSFANSASGRDDWGIPFLWLCVCCGMGFVISDSIKDINFSKHVDSVLSIEDEYSEYRSAFAESFRECKNGSFLSDRSNIACTIKATDYIDALGVKGSPDKVLSELGIGPSG